MVILGIDPGIARVGWGVIHVSGNNFKLLASGLLETSATDQLPNRLEKIHTFSLELFHNYSPDVVAVEELFFAANTKTAFKVGQSRGVILLSASEFGIEVTSYTPLQVKQSLTGYGRADKKQVQTMVKLILKLPKMITQDDTADAVAIALTHGFSYKMARRIESSQ